MLSILKTLSLSLVAEALTGLIYHRPTGENSTFHNHLDETIASVLACEFGDKMNGQGIIVADPRQVIGRFRPEVDFRSLM